MNNLHDRLQAMSEEAKAISRELTFMAGAIGGQKGIEELYTVQEELRAANTRILRLHDELIEAQKWRGLVMAMVEKYPIYMDHVLGLLTESWLYCNEIGVDDTRPDWYEIALDLLEQIK